MSDEDLSFVAKMMDDLKESTNKHIDPIQALETDVSNTEGEVSRTNKKISNATHEKASKGFRFEKKNVIEMLGTAYSMNHINSQREHQEQT